MAYRETPRILEKKERTRALILDAAARLVKEETPLSMDAVAARAGLAVGSLYTYFRNRADLVLALFEVRAQIELDALQEALEKHADAAEAIAAAIRVALQRARRNPGMTLFLLLERMDRDERLEAAKLAYHRKHSDNLAAAIRRGEAQGLFPLQNAEVTAAAVLGMLIEIMIRAFARRGDAVAELPPSRLETETIRRVLGACGHSILATR